MLNEISQDSIISQTKLIKEIIKITKVFDNLEMDERNIRKRFELLRRSSFELGIRRYKTGKKFAYKFDENKKEIVKFLTIPKSSNLFSGLEIEPLTFSKLISNNGVRRIRAEEKKKLVEAFERLITKEKSLGLSDELAERNTESFWKFIREDTVTLEAKIDFANDFFYQYDLFEDVLQYRAILMEIADDEIQADMEFQEFIDRFTELESYLLAFCKEYFTRKIHYKTKETHFEPYSLDRYFRDKYDEDEYDYRYLNSEEILSILTEILTNGR